MFWAGVIETQEVDRLKYLGEAENPMNLRGDQPEAGRDGNAAYGKVQDRSKYGGAMGRDGGGTPRNIENVSDLILKPYVSETL